MMHFMNAGSAAEFITLTDDTLKTKMTAAVTPILHAKIYAISEGSVSKAIVSTVSNVHRVPTKEDASN